MVFVNDMKSLQFLKNDPEAKFYFAEDIPKILADKKELKPIKASWLTLFGWERTYNGTAIILITTPVADFFRLEGKPFNHRDLEDRSDIGDESIFLKQEGMPLEVSISGKFGLSQEQRERLTPGFAVYPALVYRPKDDIFWMKDFQTVAFSKGYELPLDLRFRFYCS